MESCQRTRPTTNDERPATVPLPARRTRPYSIGSHPKCLEAIMTTAQFFDQLDARIAKYDLLCHPFYKAWSAGELTRDDLRAYAQDYYHHVEAFPDYLAAFAGRLEDGEVRRCVLANMADEKGLADGSGASSRDHADLWLDFAEGMGSTRNLAGHTPAAEIRELTEHFDGVAREGSAEEALAA